MNPLTTRFAELRQRMESACARLGRDPGSVQLVAVSKTFGAEDIATLARAGQVAFGENYLQEALCKIPSAEKEAGHGLQWHFLGPIQSNKAGAIGAHFSWVHSVARLKVAQRLSALRPRSLPPLSVCLQVNISGESSKSGCTPAEAAALCTAIAELPRMRLRGLMCIPQVGDSRNAYRGLRHLFQDIRATGNVDSEDFDTLSMGMSDDFEIAIGEGATMIRIGTALFGPRMGVQTDVQE